MLRENIADFEQKSNFLKNRIESIQDYPIKGVLFRDISSLCEDREAFSLTIDMLYELFKDKQIDKVVSAEARGFVFGAPLATKLKAGFVMVRKPHKLPRKTICESYELEYGANVLHINKDAIKPGEKVLLVDDLLATGGTVVAMAKLVKKLQADIVNAAFVIDLVDLGGKEKIKKETGVDSIGLLDFPGH